MPTRHHDSDTPTVTDWVVGFLLAAFVVFGIPAIVELVAAAVTP